MGVLTEEEIRLLLSLVSQEVVIARSDDFPFTVTRNGMGYNTDLERARLQGKLSIMLEVAAAR